MTVQNLFLTSFVTLLTALDLTVGLALSPGDIWLRWVIFLLICIFNISLVYEITQIIFSSLLKAHDLPHLSHLEQTPLVAILYLTRDDVMPELLARLRDQTYPNATVFVLDDSTDKAYQSVVDGSGYQVVRRGHRVDFKAGNLNHWLQLYGDKFPYFIVLDNDSLVPPDFVERLVQYAEHPDNQDAAIFQSKVFFWNLDLPFSQALEALLPLRHFLMERMGNRCQTVLPTNNFLARTAALGTIGGFTTHSVTEDWATGLKLLAQEYRCQLVNVDSSMAASSSAIEHTRRLGRWGSGLLQIVLNGVGEIPLTTHMRVAIGLLDYLIRPLQIGGLILLAWGTTSTWQDVYWLARLWRAGHFLRPPLIYWTLLMGVYLGYLFIFRPLIAKSLGVPFLYYFRHVLLWSALHLYALFPLTQALGKTLLGVRPTFDRTLPRSRLTTFVALIREMSGSMVVLGIILIGLLRNPLVLILNWMWILPLLVAPFVLHRSQSSFLTPRR